MKFRTLKNKSLKELNKMLFQKRAKLLELRFKVASNELKKINKIRETRKDIARLLTAINNFRREKTQ